MQKRFTLFFTCIISIIFTTFKAQNRNVLPTGLKEQKSSDIVFTENKGQVHDQHYKARPDVLFSGTDGKLVFHLKNNGISYQLNRIDSWKEEEDHKTKEKRQAVDKTTVYRVDINWLNANTKATLKTGQALEGYNNYYLESCPNGAINVKSYIMVEYQNIYKGINLKWYQKKGQLKYDYVVAPHANYKQIQLEIKGADLQLQKNGSLNLKTPLGTIEEHAPRVYQNRKQLKANYVLKGNVLSFNVENYDPNQQLIIDPAVRVWGTYYGGSGDDDSEGCSIDGSENVFIVGYTNSSSGTVIATVGSHQSSIGGSYDAFLVKFNSLGVRQWSTYYGGTGTDYGRSCVTDLSGNVYIAGTTQSTAGISTSGSHQLLYSGSSDDFIVKFNSSGVRQWASYYGGSGSETGGSCSIDPFGNIYLAGSTTSSINISTPGSHQVSYNVGIGAYDAFLVKFNSSGVRQWGTYYGGSGGEYGMYCITDAIGNVYLAGNTNSNTTNVIATVGAHQSANGGGYWDAFLVKFNANGMRQWGTYYGGSLDDFSYSCTTDVSGNVYLSGKTMSNTGTVIATVGAHQSVFGGLDDAFLVKFNANGVRQWGTYYGGSGPDVGNSCTTDTIGNVYLAGYTESNTGTVIATAGAHQGSLGGYGNAFLVKFNSSGVREWGTYYGGSQSDYGLFCNTDDTGNIYLVGEAASNTGTAIATVGAHQSAHGGVSTWDGFLVKFKDCPTLVASINANTPLCQNSTLNFTTSVTSTLTLNYNWQGPNSFVANIQNPNIVNAGTVNSGTYTCSVNDGQGCSETRTVGVIVNLKPIVVVNSGSICSGNSFTINPSGANTYTIQGGNAVVSPNSTSAFTVVGTSINGCLSDIATSNVTVLTIPIPSISVNSGSICSGNSFTISPSGANTYTIQGGNAVVSPNTNTSYTVIGTGTNGCVSNIVTSNVTVFATPTIAINSGAICSGNSFTINPSGATSYTIEGSNAVVSPSVNTSYTIVGTSTAGCISNTFATANVTVNPPPIIIANSSNTLICVGQSATVSASGAVNYTWSPAIPMNGVVSPSTTITYTVIGEDANGCQNTSVLTQSVDACTGIDQKQIDQNNSTIYPNPSTGIFNLDVNQATELSVYNNLGQLIYHKINESGNIKIDLSQFANGVYMLRLKVSNNQNNYRIIKSE
jgi:hypothetical protein